MKPGKIMILVCLTVLNDRLSHFFYFTDLPESEIILTALSYSYLVEQNGISLVSPTQKLMYLMTSFLGPDTKFLDSTIKNVIQQTFLSLTSSNAKVSNWGQFNSDGLPISNPTPIFNFEVKLEGKKSFESLYFVFLDVFQSSGYGDALFSALVMVPLAQRYDVKWRKRVWSEHAAVLRFITCKEDQVSLLN